MPPDAKDTPPGPGSAKEPRPGDSRESPQSVGDAVADTAEKVRELSEYISYYISTKIDALRQAIRRFGILAGMGVLAVIIVAALLVTAIVLICLGISEGVSQLFPYHHWLANVITGAAVLGISLGIVWLMVRRMASASRRLMMEKYESRRRKQKAHFGHDIGQAERH